MIEDVIKGYPIFIFIGMGKTSRSIGKKGFTIHKKMTSVSAANRNSDKLTSKNAVTEKPGMRD
jgi:hypothetical protein